VRRSLLKGELKGTIKRFSSSPVRGGNSAGIRKVGIIRKGDHWTKKSYDKDAPSVLPIVLEKAEKQRTPLAISAALRGRRKENRETRRWTR